MKLPPLHNCQRGALHIAEKGMPSKAAEITRRKFDLRDMHFSSTENILAKLAEGLWDLFGSTPMHALHQAAERLDQHQWRAFKQGLTIARGTDRWDEFTTPELRTVRDNLDATTDAGKALRAELGKTIMRRETNGF